MPVSSQARCVPGWMARSRTALILAALSITASSMLPSAHAAGFGTNAQGAYEELRFYTPATGAILTDTGTVDQGAYACDASRVCATGLRYVSQVAGAVTAYGYVNGAAGSLTIQTLTPGHTGLGTVSLDAQGQILGSAAVDQGETLTLFFAQPTRLVGFDFFTTQQQAFAPDDTTPIRVMVDERIYTLSAGQAAQTTLVGSEFTFLGGSTSYYLGAVRVAATPVPEADGLAMMALGLVGVAVITTRARRAT